MQVGGLKAPCDIRFAAVQDFDDDADKDLEAVPAKGWHVHAFDSHCVRRELPTDLYIDDDELMLNVLRCHLTY